MAKILEFPTGTHTFVYLDSILTKVNKGLSIVE